MFTSVLLAQDVPLFTQKLTNSFLFNPSVAGKTLGSLTLSHRQYWSGLQGSPSTDFLSFHTPFGKHRFGLGANLFQDKIGAAQTLYASAAFAYHIRFRKDNSLSMGLSAEYDHFKIDPTKVDVIDLDDELLQKNASYNHVDVSFGMSYKSKYFKLGASANRISTLVQKDSTNQFPPYYSGFINFLIPVAGDRDLLEPIVTFRSLSATSNQLDLGLFYTYNNKLTLGGSYRSGAIISGTIAVKVLNSLSIGYSRDIYSESFGRNIGSSNEFTLRLDFKDHDYHARSKNAHAINTSALAVRRKTLSTYNGKGTAAQKSKRYKKMIKRKYLNSPNYRMDSSNKLNTMRMKKKPAHRSGKRNPRRK